MSADGGIDGEQKQKELRAAIMAMGPLDQQQLDYLTPMTLIRYLRARQGNVHNAAKMLHATLVWRKTMHLDTLHTEEFDKQLAAGPLYVVPDSSGHSILMTRKQSETGMPAGPKGFDQYIRFLVFTAETCVRAMGQGQHQWVWILDMANYNRANSPPLNVSLATLRVLADHYPERLKLAVFVNAPSIFSWLWSALSPFLDQVTRKKVMFVKSSDLPASVFQGQTGQHAIPPGGEPPPARPHKQSPAVAAAVEAFLPYAHHWLTPYNESAYRQLLTGLGWPASAPAQTNPIQH